MKKVISIALIAMLVVAMAGCSQSQPAPTAAPAETPAQTTAAPQTEAPAALSGTVATDGSTSMEKVIGALGEAFMEANSGVNFTYNPPAPAPASPPYPKAAATSDCPPVL